MVTSDLDSKVEEDQIIAELHVHPRSHDKCLMHYVRKLRDIADSRGGLDYNDAIWQGFCNVELPHVTHLDANTRLVKTQHLNDAKHEQNLKCGAYENSHIFVNKPSIVCVEKIFESSHFTCIIFRMPKGAVIPLHDHPGMYVLGKVLFGKLQVDSFDVQKDASLPPGRVKATRLPQQVFTPDRQPPFPVVEPEARNIHYFTALEECAVLEIQFPPYSDEHGRPRNYYEAFEVKPDEFEMTILPNGAPESFTRIWH